jgi:GT2 family glycosyltransferase
MALPEDSLLSVVVVIVSDTAEVRGSSVHLRECLQALADQIDPPRIEVIVPHLDNVEKIDFVRAAFPWVRWLLVSDVVARIGGREHHDVLRARGLAAARGAIVGLLEDHARPDPRWCANVVAAHREPYAAIGGAIENGVEQALNWAVYYCDFGRYQNPLPAGETAFASDANVTYKRGALQRVHAAWCDSFSEVVVHEALKSRGETIALDPRIIVYQNRQGLTIQTALRERFAWGRSYAATRLTLLTGPRRLVYACLSPLLPAVLLFRMAYMSWRRRSFGTFARAVHITSLLTATWSAGEGVGYLLGVEPPRIRPQSR